LFLLSRKPDPVTTKRREEESTGKPREDVRDA